MKAIAGMNLQTRAQHSQLQSKIFASCDTRMRNCLARASLVSARSPLIVAQVERAAAEFLDEHASACSPQLRSRRSIALGLVANAGEQVAQVRITTNGGAGRLDDHRRGGSGLRVFCTLNEP